MGTNLIDIWAAVTRPQPADSKRCLPSAQKAGIQLNHFLSGGPCLLVLLSRSSAPPVSPSPPPTTYCRLTCQILIACVLPLHAIFPLPPQEQPHSSSEARLTLCRLNTASCMHRLLVCLFVFTECDFIKQCYQNQFYEKKSQSLSSQLDTVCINKTLFSLSLFFCM